MTIPKLKKWLPAVAVVIFNACLVYTGVFNEYFEHKGYLWNHMAPETITLVTLLLLAPVVAFCPSSLLRRRQIYRSVSACMLIAVLCICFPKLSFPAAFVFVTALAGLGCVAAIMVAAHSSEEEERMACKGVGHAAWIFAAVFYLTPLVFDQIDKARESAPFEQFKKNQIAISLNAAMERRLTYQGKQFEVLDLVQIQSGEVVYKLKSTDGKLLFLEEMGYEGNPEVRYVPLDAAAARKMGIDRPSSTRTVSYKY